MNFHYSSVYELFFKNIFLNIGFNKFYCKIVELII